MLEILKIIVKIQHDEKLMKNDLYILEDYKYDLNRNGK